MFTIDSLRKFGSIHLVLVLLVCADASCKALSLTRSSLIRTLHQIQFMDATSQGKHKKSARRNLDEVKAFLAKVDAHLAEIAETSGASAGAAAGGESSAKSAKAEVKTPASGKKRKPSDATGGKESSKKKKATREDLGPLTIPQREQRALEQLGNYLEEVGGESSAFIFV